jgi:hypothetical protein
MVSWMKRLIAEYIDELKSEYEPVVLDLIYHTIYDQLLEYSPKRKHT